MKKKDFALGILCGAILFTGATTTTAGITAEPTWQNIYVDGEQVSMTASRSTRTLHTPARPLYRKQKNCQPSKKSGRR